MYTCCKKNEQILFIKVNGESKSKDILHLKPYCFVEFQEHC